MALHDPYISHRRALVVGALESSGELNPVLRDTLFWRAQLPPATETSANERDGVPELLGKFVDKVARTAYKVTDADINALIEAGYSEEQVFEAIICTAVGAGMLRMDLGVKAMQGDE